MSHVPEVSSPVDANKHSSTPTMQPPCDLMGFSVNFSVNAEAYSYAHISVRSGINTGCGHSARTYDELRDIFQFHDDAICHKRTLVRSNSPTLHQSTSSQSGVSLTTSDKLAVLKFHRKLGQRVVGWMCQLPSCSTFPIILPLMLGSLRPH